MNLLHRFIRTGRPASTGSSHRILAYVIAAQRSTSYAFLQVNKYSSVSVWVAANSLSMWPQGKLKTRACRADITPSAVYCCTEAPVHATKG